MLRLSVDSEVDCPKVAEEVKATAQKRYIVRMAEK